VTRVDCALRAGYLCTYNSDTPKALKMAVPWQRRWFASLLPWSSRIHSMSVHVGIVVKKCH